jgi:hypothetical protein
MPELFTPESICHLLRTFETDQVCVRLVELLLKLFNYRGSRICILGSASPRRSSRNQLHTLIGPGQPTGPRPALGREVIQGGSAYGYAGFPWTDEPQNMSMPALSTPESIPRLSRTFETDNTSTLDSASPRRSSAGGCIH